MPSVLGLVSFRIFPTHMGGQKGVALFYQYLSKYCEVKLAVSNDNVESKTVPIEKILYPNKKIYKNIFKLSGLKKMLTKNKTDLIIAEHSYAGWIAWLLHRSTGKPFIVHSHNIESMRFRQMNKWWWKIYQAYEGWIHRKAQHNFFISREDKDFAIAKFRLDEKKCTVVTYGIEQAAPEKNRCDLREQLELPSAGYIFLFNGTLDYEPNYDAVVHIVDIIEPMLRKKLSDFKILIAGNRAPKNLIKKILSNQNILYVGYVKDVNEYYCAANLFLNPVANNTGVKTKLIEAIANNCTAISTVSGASGIAKELCGNKLVTTPDHDWNNFVEQIILHTVNENAETPQAFYDYYNWKNITAISAEKINELAGE